MTFTRRTTRLAAGLGVAGATVLLLAGPAAADTSQASATAARVEVLGSPIVDTGAASASNPGLPADDTDTGSTGILSGQTLVTAGVLAQAAIARGDGTSAACAGAVGSGGTIQVGAAPACTVNMGTPDGVSVNLNPGLVTLGADAIYAECTATTAGATGTATLVDANIFLLNPALPPITIAPNPAPNAQVLNVPGIASIILNEQIPVAGGGLTVNALHITVLSNAVTGTPAAEIIIGSVTCGPNAVAPPISIFAGPALPTAVAGAAAVGAVVFFRRRRQAA